MYYDILDLRIPDAELLSKPKPALFKPDDSKVGMTLHNEITDIDEDEEDYLYSLWLFCDLLEEADRWDYFLIRPEKGNELIRRAEELFAAFRLGKMLEPYENSEMLINFELTEEDKLRYIKVEKEARFVIESLCYYGQFQWVSHAVKDFYLQYIEEDNDICVRFDFSDLFLKVGDICLFHHNNYFFAREFYILAALNWDEETCCNPYPSVFKQTEHYKWFISDLANEVNDSWFHIEHPLLIHFKWNDMTVPDEETTGSLEYYHFGNKWEEFLTEIQRGGVNDGAYLQIHELIELYLAHQETVGRTSDLNVISLEHRCMTGLLIEAKYYLLADCMDKLYYEKNVKDRYCDKVLSCFVQNVLPVRGPLTLVQDYVSEKIRSYRLWMLSNDIDYCHFIADYHTMLSLAAFQRIVNEILFELKLNVDENTKLAFYTTYNNLGYIFWKEKDKADNKGRIPLFHVAYMNDPNEGRILIQYLTELTHKENERKNLREPYVYLKCFTDQIDDLPMWKMYGENAGGVCVVLSGWYFPGLTENSDSENAPVILGEKEKLTIYRVLYMKKNGTKEKYELDVAFNTSFSVELMQKIKEELDQLKHFMLNDQKNQEWYISSMGKLRYLFKDADYYHENETRIIMSGAPKTFELTDKDIPMLYQYSPGYPEIEEIIIGPKFEDRAKRVMYMQAMIDKAYRQPHMAGKMKDPKITYSTIDYR